MADTTTPQTHIALALPTELQLHVFEDFIKSPSPKDLDNLLRTSTPHFQLFRDRGKPIIKAKLESIRDEVSREKTASISEKELDDAFDERTEWANWALEWGTGD